MKREFRNLALLLDKFRLRVITLIWVVLLCFLLLGTRLIYLQIIQYRSLHEQAESNRLSLLPIVPARGKIIDRNGLVLADDIPILTLEITPAKVKNTAQVIDKLSQMLSITKRDRLRFSQMKYGESPYESIPIRTFLTKQEVSTFTAHAYEFPGVEVKGRLYRNYPLGATASHLIGYVGRINQREKDRIEEDGQEANYRGSKYIGKNGIEKSYESVLHGVTGFRKIEVAASGRAIKILKREPAIPGKTVQLSIDIKLQKLIEEMYGQRAGALVAIDPRTNEVIAFVSSPTFDPNLFVDGIDQTDWDSLNADPFKPLIDRALRSTYPPGSTYKPFMALGALQTGTRTPDTVIYDPGYFMYGGHRFGSPEGEQRGNMDMARAITQSSNAYFFSLAVQMGIDKIYQFMHPLGFGEKTGIDLVGEASGILPSPEWKAKRFARYGRQYQIWYPGDTVSLGIGQGYNNFTMLQMANGLTTLVNGGHKGIPHVEEGLIDPQTQEEIYYQAPPKVKLGYDPKNIAVVLNAMMDVPANGTSSAVFRGAAYTSGGKTGTAQAFTLTKGQAYNVADISYFERDHSLYEAFAPAVHPTIVVVAIVENAGFGTAAAAPIIRRAMDYWISGLYPIDQDILAVQKGRARAPIGKPYLAAQIPWPPPKLGATADHLIALTPAEINALKAPDGNPLPSSVLAAYGGQAAAKK